MIPQALFVLAIVMLLSTAGHAQSCNIIWEWEYRSLRTQINDRELPENKNTREWIELDMRGFQFATAAQRAETRAMELEQRLPVASQLIACALIEEAKELGSRRARLWRLRVQLAESSWDLLVASALSFYYTAGELYSLAGNERRAVEHLRRVVEVGVGSKLMPGLVEKARFALEDIKETQLRKRERKLERIQEEIIGLLDALASKSSPLKTE